MLDALGEEARQLTKLVLDRLRCRNSVAIRRELDAHHRARLAVEATAEIVTLCTELDARDIAQAQGTAIGFRAQDDLAKFGCACKLALDENGCSQILARRVGRGADLTGSNLGVSAR